MKVNIEFENTDHDGEVTRSTVFAIMEKRAHDYRFVYVEDLSGDGNMTRSTLIVSKHGLRIIRQGELNTDFMYEPRLVHNTTYATPYGKFPVSIETKEYSYTEGGDNILSADVKYYLSMNGDEPLNMRIKIKVFVCGN